MEVDFFSVFDSQKFEVEKRFNQRLRVIEEQRSAEFSELENELFYPRPVSEREFLREEERYVKYLEMLGKEKTQELREKIGKKFLKRLKQISARKLNKNDLHSFFDNCRWRDEFGYYFESFLSRRKDEGSFDNEKLWLEGEFAESDYAYFDGVSQSDFVEDIIKQGEMGYFLEMHIRSPQRIKQMIGELRKSVKKGDTHLSTILLRGYFENFFALNGTGVSTFGYVDSFKRLSKNQIEELRGLQKEFFESYVSGVVTPENLVMAKLEVKEMFEKSAKDIAEYSISDYDEEEFDLRGIFGGISYNLRGKFEDLSEIEGACGMCLNLPEIDGLVSFFNKRLEGLIEGKKASLQRAEKIKLKKKEKLLKEREERMANLEEIVSSMKFGIGTDFKIGNIGKVIMCYEQSENQVMLRFSKYKGQKLPVFNKNSSASDMRYLFASDNFSYEVGLHKHIERPEGSVVLGGGAYVVLPGKVVHVDYHSMDFGQMSFEILERCFSDSKYVLDVWGESDRSYFDEDRIEKYLIRKGVFSKI